MPDGQVLEFTRVTKRFGAVDAVSDFSARIEPGLVTGFLGPNGAGKTTTLRMLLGLIRPTSGTATIGGARYADLKHPLQTVGAALEASSFHPGRTGANHLKVYARAAGIPLSRVDEVLGLVDLSDAADRKVGGYSLGMRQRLGLATAMLGDPGVIVLDEPANGLDPEGIRWMRSFLRQLAREGRTVLTSSHLLTEVQQTAQALVIISRGRLVFQGGIHELAPEDEHAVVVDSPDRAALVQALRDAQVPFEVLRVGLTVRAADTATIGAVAATAGVALSSLQKRGPGLEEVFFELVNGLRVHPSASGISGTLEAAQQAPVETPPPAPVAPPAPADTTATSALPVIPEPSVDAATPSETSTSQAEETQTPIADATAAADAVAEVIPSEAEDAQEPVASAVADAHTSDDEELESVADDVEPDEAEPVASATDEDAQDDSDESAPEPEPERPLPGMSGLAAMAASMSSGVPIDDDTPSPFGSLFGGSSWASRIDTDSDTAATDSSESALEPFTPEESAPEAADADAAVETDETAADEAPVAFQVASTGVIDIIPVFDESEQGDSEQDASEQESEQDDSTERHDDAEQQSEESEDLGDGSADHDDDANADESDTSTTAEGEQR